MLVEVVYRKLLVGGAVAASVEVGLPVGCNVLVLLVVLGPVEMYNIHTVQPILLRYAIYP